MTKTKELFFFGILLAVAFGIGLITAEVALHILPPSITSIEQTPRLAPHDEIGFIREANTQAHVYSSCLHIDPITMNGLGFRDDPWPNVATNSIAILGDSFMEAVVVGDDQTTAAHLQKILGRPVLNAGISSFGTASQLETYRTFIKERKPELVVAFVYPENDITDNHCAFSKGPNGTVTQVCANPTDNGSYELNKNLYRSGGNSILKKVVKEHCRLCSLVRRQLGALRAGSQPTEPGEFNAYPVYNTQPDETMQEAWGLTYQLLRDLQAEVEQASSTLVIALVPSLLSVSPDWKQELEQEYAGVTIPETYNIEYPRRRLRAMANEMGIPLIDLQPTFANLS